MNEESRRIEAERAAEEYKLILFMSVDLSGSTAYKYSSSITDIEFYANNNERSWRSVIEVFYKDFTTSLADHWERNINYFKKEIHALNELARPKLWKALGDELIFEIEIFDKTHAFLCLKTFIDTINSSTDVIKQKSEKLGLKGAAWLAGFPGENAQIRLDWDREKNQATGFEHYDYIGPSMDTGFRLSTQADRRRLPISIELAYILSTLSEKKGNFHMNFGYSGRKKLKGVLQDDGYPLVWIDVEMDDYEKRIIGAEEALISVDKRCSDSNIRSLATAFISGSKWIFYPFLKKEADEECPCKSPPEPTLKWAEQIIQNEQDDEAQQQMLSESLTQNDGSASIITTITADELLNKMPKK